MKPNLKSEAELRKLLLLKRIEEDKARMRVDFYFFCCKMVPDFFTIAKPYLKEICDLFQKVAEGEINKLAISIPPRCGKSLIASLFCAWCIGRDNNSSIMRNSYGAELAEKFSRDIRDTFIISEAFKLAFSNIEVSKNMGAIDSWSINGKTQPTYFCSGVGGAITGMGAKTASILDDPIKNIEEAISENTLEKKWQWFIGVHRTRYEKNFFTRIKCPEIHIATRWSRNDIIGRLTDPESIHFDKNFVCYVKPALNENEESNFPDIMSTEEMLDLKKSFSGGNEFIWEAEYQQNPIEMKGLLYNNLNTFKMSELNGNPDGIIGFTDTADTGTDSLCTPFGARYGNRTYIIDVVFSQLGVEYTEPMVAGKIIDTKCDIMTIEANNGGKQYARNIRNLISGKQACTVVSETQSSNKETRILMNAGYIKENFWFRSDYEEGSDYDKYMRALKNYKKEGGNKHDDAPDATTGLAEWCKLNLHFKKPKKEPPKGIFSKSQLEDMGYKSKDYGRAGVSCSTMLKKLG